MAIDRIMSKYWSELICKGLVNIQTNKENFHNFPTSHNNTNNELKIHKDKKQIPRGTMVHKKTIQNMIYNVKT